jgi:L-asparaginase II
MNADAIAAVAPVLVEVTRGDMVESRHRGAVAVVDASGRVVEAHGDIDRPVYARSAIKPLQALPLVETGAADALAVTPPEIAIACASHGGEPEHVRAVGAWLLRLGLTAADLECGAHPPRHGPSALALARAGEAPSALHNNCSGKHTGMVATCRHLGERIRGYIAPEHPAQLRIVRVFEEMCGLDLSRAPRGTDGCGLPQIGMPLRALAHGFARLGSPDALPPGRAAACRRIAAAMVAHPFMLAGTDRYCTQATLLARGKAVLKTGAEGVYLAAIPAAGFGISLKIEDGGTRAAEVAMTALLLRHAGLDDSQKSEFAALLAPKINNVAGRLVGGIAPAPGW